MIGLSRVITAECRPPRMYDVCPCGPTSHRPSTFISPKVTVDTGATRFLTDSSQWDPSSSPISLHLLAPRHRPNSPNATIQAPRASLPLLFRGCWHVATTVGQDTHDGRWAIVCCKKSMMRSSGGIATSPLLQKHRPCRKGADDANLKIATPSMFSETWEML